MNIKFHFFFDYQEFPKINIFFDYFKKEGMDFENAGEKIFFKLNDLSIDNKAEFVLNNISEVPHIVNLSKNYKDFKFFAEFPLVLSSFHYEQIFNVISGLNELYPVYYFCEDLVGEITKFDLDDIINKLISYRDSFVKNAELGSVNKQFYIDRPVLDFICDYQIKRQRIIDSFYEDHKSNINVNPFIALHKIKHNETHEISFAVDLNLEYMSIIPNYVDYFYVPTPDGDGHSLVKSSIVLKDIDQYLSNYKMFIQDAKILDHDQQAKAAKKFKRKLKRYAKKASDKNDFEIIPLFGLLDK